MATIESLRSRYRDLDRIREEKTNAAIDRNCLLAFDYEYTGADSEVLIEMSEFTAECPWTGLPDALWLPFVLSIITRRVE